MAINQDIQIPTFCKNCTHRFVCGIQVNFKEQDKDISEFNQVNVPSKQSITSTNYLCRYKGIDTTI